MIEWLLWLKALHIISVVAWMAGLFYLPRLFVYHSGVSPGGEASELFKTMERRLMAAIMRPAMVVSLLSGGFLLSLAQFGLSQFWVEGKLAAVLLLILFHGLLEVHLRQFAMNLRTRTGRYFRIINEIPTVLLIIIVIFVVVKPFQ